MGQLVPLQPGDGYLSRRFRPRHSHHQRLLCVWARRDDRLAADHMVGLALLHVSQHYFASHNTSSSWSSSSWSSPVDVTNRVTTGSDNPTMWPWAERSCGPLASHRVALVAMAVFYAALPLAPAEAARVGLALFSTRYFAIENTVQLMTAM
jgi:hypothetical protein